MALISLSAEDKDTVSIHDVSGIEFALFKKAFGRRGKYRELGKAYSYEIKIGDIDLAIYTKKGE